MSTLTKSEQAAFKRYYYHGAQHMEQLIEHAIGKGMNSVEINNVMAIYLTQLEQWVQSPQSFPPPSGYDLLGVRELNDVELQWLSVDQEDNHGIGYNIKKEEQL